MRWVTGTVLLIVKRLLFTDESEKKKLQAMTVISGYWLQMICKSAKKAVSLTGTFSIHILWLQEMTRKNVRKKQTLWVLTTESGR